MLHSFKRSEDDRSIIKLMNLAFTTFLSIVFKENSIVHKLDNVCFVRISYIFMIY